MEIKIKESIDINSIDLDKCYFNPGCAMLLEEPDSAKRIYEFLKKHYGEVKYHDICCQHNPKVPENSFIINNCAGCDKRWNSLYEGVSSISIWEILDSIDNLPLPKYEGLTVSIQDPCPIRNKPQIHLAVRSLLKKMGINILEAEAHGTKSVCCGDDFYPKLSKEKIADFQKYRVNQMPSNNIAVYCVSCAKSLGIEDRTIFHMVDLVLNKKTEMDDTDIECYHAQVKEYKEAH